MDSTEKIVDDSLRRDDIDVRHDQTKFRELLLLVAHKLAGLESRGALKVNKVLYYADFGHFRAHGVPITGAPYRKLEMGPAPRFLEDQRKALIRDGSVELVKEQVALGYVQHWLRPLREPNLAMFTPSELQAVDEAVSLLRDDTGADASERSHREPGWRLMEYGEDIPYVTALLPQEQPQPSTKMRAQMRQLAAQADDEGRLAR